MNTSQSTAVSMQVSNRIKIARLTMTEGQVPVRRTPWKAAPRSASALVSMLVPSTVSEPPAHLKWVKSRSTAAAAAAALLVAASNLPSCLCRSSDDSSVEVERVISSSSSSPISYPVSSGRRRRRLEDEYGYDYSGGAKETDEDDYFTSFAYDMSEYSVKYERCQSVKAYSDDLAAEGYAFSVLSGQHFVVFRLCPSSSCSSCDQNYGEYVLPAEDYLSVTTQMAQTNFAKLCQECREACSAGDCDTGCSVDCNIYENLGSNGYVDASNFVECQQVTANNDDGNDADDNGGESGDNGNDDGSGQQQLYIGPRCSSNGSRIFIGLFEDEECGIPYQSSDGTTVADVIGAKLWYRTLEKTYLRNTRECNSCASNDSGEGGGNGNVDDVGNVNEMCQQVYAASAKCESRNGITAGFIQTSRSNGREYGQSSTENPFTNENMACTFVESLVLNSYTEIGEIDIFEEQDVVFRQATNLQIMMLTLLSLIMLGLGSYAMWLSRSIDYEFSSIRLPTCGEGIEGTLT